jgi:RHS repeat-associated protein
MAQQLVQKSGAKVWEGEYRAFGALVAEEGAWENRLRFPGQYYDQETNNYYNYFRDYDPRTGRYLQSDPIGLWGGFNTYVYVYGNPVILFDPYGLWAWGDPIPQSVVDYSAGFGDTISFGFTDWVRDRMDTNSSVNKCSSAYSAGEWTGVGYGFAAGGAAGWRIGASRTATRTEFSHWIPNRMGGPRSAWNGNYVSPRTHAMSDPYRYRFMPRDWKDANPIWPAPARQAARLPYWIPGMGMGGSAAAGSAANGNDCECQN